MIQRIALFPSPVKRALDGTIEIIQWLKTQGIKVYMPEQALLPEDMLSLVASDETIKNESQIIISLGGDGTLLRAARYIYGTAIPIMGVNLGTLGFLTEVPMSSWKQAMQVILKGNYRTVERMLLACEVKRSGETIFSGFALNDAVIHRGWVSRILHLSISINSRYVGTYSSDGLIISTPTGSTAYSLSAGGPIISPDVSCLLLTAICPHTLSARPLIISEKEKVSVQESQVDGISLSLDGHMNFVLKKDDIIMVEKAASGVRFLQLEDNFYGVVREKLKWVAPHYEEKT